MKRSIVSIVAGLVVVSIFCFIAHLDAAAQPPARTALMVGSSSVGGALGDAFQSELAALDVRLARRVHTSAGFARPDFFDLENELALLPAVYRHEAVLLYAGGNDTQALYLRSSERGPAEPGTARASSWVRWSDEARWSEVYVARVRNGIERLCAAGAERVIVLLPVNGGRAVWTSRIERVRTAQAHATRLTQCGVVVDAGGEIFESRDGVHLTRAGALDLFHVIGPTVRALFESEP